jgi:outer membrane immunogenic protein
MRRISLAIAAGALSFSAIEGASAQDILRMMYSPVQAINWTGFYVGGNAGYGWGRSSQVGDLTALATGTANMSGAIAGGQIGTLVQSGFGVLGIEADLQGSWQKGSFASPGTFGGAPYLLNETNSLRWFATARGRAGVAQDRFLAYGTAGVAYGEFRNDEVVTGSLTGTSPFSTYRFGWVVGGGLEFMLARNWTLRGEYLHIDFGSFTQAFIVTTGGVSTTANINYKVTNDIVRIGVNYFFR